MIGGDEKLQFNVIPSWISSYKIAFLEWRDDWKLQFKEKKKKSDVKIIRWRDDKIAFFIKSLSLPKRVVWDYRKIQVVDLPENMKWFRTLIKP